MLTRNILNQARSGKSLGTRLHFNQSGFRVYVSILNFEDRTVIFPTFSAFFVQMLKCCKTTDIELQINKKNFNLPICCVCMLCYFSIMQLKDAVQSVCKQRLCLHFGIQNIEFYSTTIYIFMILEYNKLSRDNNQALQEHKMK